MPPTRFFSFLTVVLVALLAGCAALPSLEGRTVSTHLADTAETRLGRATQALEQAHPGDSGLLRLTNGRDAFAARLRLADVAERSLDVQYYIWHNDLTGTLLLESLRRAADRGVRVRLLLDDGGTRDFDDVTATLLAHPNIEVRLFNPFTLRHWTSLNYLTDFSRLNRRMHNKSFTADNRATIVGGRNIGDEYFGADQDLLFIDLDVAAIGPVVDAVSVDFDRYWASESAYPAGRLIEAAPAESIAKTTADAARIEHSEEAAVYAEDVVQQPLVRRMLAGDLTFEWAKATFVSDDPAKGMARAPAGELMWTRLKRVMKPPEHGLDLVSAYFVPGSAGVEYLSGLARAGEHVTVLTNSFESTDVAAVHAGYAKWRKPLLEAGVALWEVKRTSNGGPAPSRYATGSRGSSGSSLHTKAFEIDRSQVFIGSFNFDPRSRQLNTELGLVIDSPSMAADIADRLASHIAERAYRVRLGPDGALQWVEQVDGAEIVHDTEPGTTFWQRVGVAVLSLLPIDWLL